MISGWPINTGIVSKTWEQGVRKEIEKKRSFYGRKNWNVLPMICGNWPSTWVIKSWEVNGSRLSHNIHPPSSGITHSETNNYKWPCNTDFLPISGRRLDSCFRWNRNRESARTSNANTGKDCGIRWNPEQGLLAPLTFHRRPPEDPIWVIHLAKRWQVKLNVDKLKLLIIPKSPTNHSHAPQLKIVNTLKILGAHFDNKFGWNNHIETLRKHWEILKKDKLLKEYYITILVYNI